MSFLAGGNAAWLEAKLPCEQGVDRATTSLDDVWYRLYDNRQDYEKHACAYLDWEVALIDKIKRDPTIKFRVRLKIKALQRDMRPPRSTVDAPALS